MKGKPAVLAQLHKLLRGELAARDQYFIHSRMYQDWGLEKLYARIDHEMQDETGHASILIERILFLEDTPDLSQQDQIRVGKNVPEMLQFDYQSRDLLLKILADTEEDHAYWLEKQLGLIEKIGLQNYLQSQIG